MSEAQPSQPTVLLLSGDLFFSSKVTGTAGSLGLEVEVRATMPDVCAHRLVIIDLGSTVSPTEVMSRLPQTNRPRVIAYGQHVATGRLQQAQEAGCDEVMPRGQFAANLAVILRSALVSEE